VSSEAQVARTELLWTLEVILAYKRYLKQKRFCASKMRSLINDARARYEAEIFAASEAILETLADDVIRYAFSAPASTLMAHLKERTIIPTHPYTMLDWVKERRRKEGTNGI